MQDERQKLADNLVSGYTELIEAARVHSVDVDCLEEARGNARFLKKHGIGEDIISEDKVVRHYNRIADEVFKLLSR